MTQTSSGGIKGKTSTKGTIDTEAALWILTLLGIAVYLYLLMGA